MCLLLCGYNKNVDTHGSILKGGGEITEILRYSPTFKTDLLSSG